MLFSIITGKFEDAFYYNQLLFISSPVFLFFFIESIYSKINGKKPIIDAKYDLTKHKNYKYLNNKTKLDTYGENKEIILKEAI